MKTKEEISDALDALGIMKDYAFFDRVNLLIEVYRKLLKSEAERDKKDIIKFLKRSRNSSVPEIASLLTLLPGRVRELLNELMKEGKVKEQQHDKIPNRYRYNHK